MGGRRCYLLLIAIAMVVNKKSTSEYEGCLGEDMESTEWEIF